MNAEEKVEWMRARGVVQAQWSVDGDLIMCVLGPPVVTPDPRDVDAHQPSADEPTTEELLLMSA